MSLGGAKLLFLQALVAVVAIGVWHVGSSVPIGGVYFLPKFFFSTPADVGLRVWTLFADGTAKIVSCKEAIDIGRLLSISDPCFGKTIWQHLLITLTEGVLAFVDRRGWPASCSASGSPATRCCPPSSIPTSRC